MADEPKKKYGLLPPFKLVRGPGGEVGHALIPGCTVEEWKENLPKAWAEYLASLPAEDQERIRQELNEEEKSDRRTKRPRKSGYTPPKKGKK